MDIRNYKRKIIPAVAELYNRSLMRNYERINIFLCGASEESSIRYSLKKYLEKHHSEFDISIAEVFARFEKDGIDLLTLENSLATYADSIVIILESPGAIAELGAFSNREDLRNKILAVNHQKFQDKPKEKESFITGGPIQLIKTKSLFNNILYFNDECPSLVFPDIVKEIKEKQPKRNRRVEVSELQEKDYLHLLIDLLMLLNPISKEDLSKIAVNILFPSLEEKEIRKQRNTFLTILNVIDTIGYISQCEGTEYILPKKYSFNTFFQNNNSVKLEKVRAVILNEYRKIDSNRTEVLNRHLKEMGNR